VHFMRTWCFICAVFAFNMYMCSADVPVKRRGTKRTSEGVQATQAPALAELRGVAQQAASVPVQHHDDDDGDVEGRMDVVDDGQQKVRVLVC
jgi:hypothetical protein